MSNSNAEKITITCSGGCGRTVTLRKSKVQQADYYLCQSKISGQQCEANLPPLMPGKMRRVELNAAASFWGYTDIVPDAQMAASMLHAREILAAGLTKLAIEKAGRSS